VQRPQHGEKKSSPCSRQRVGGVLGRDPIVGSCYGCGPEGREQADDERVRYGGGAGEEEHSLVLACDEPAEHQQGYERQQCERGWRKTEPESTPDTQERRYGGR